MEGDYGKAKSCFGSPEKCHDIEALTVLLAKSRDEATLRAAWLGWHATARGSRASYTRFAELANIGAKEIGFPNTGEMWRSAYDMAPDAFEKETERLWQQLKPLYDSLHCYVRRRLADTYGKDKVRPGEPIPAHLLGNMWAQQWSNIFALVEPYKGQPSLDVTAALEQQRWDPVRMVKTGERFFTSLGLPALPKTFWERSMLVKPRDREVVCHASAWDVTASGDIRIKMCIKPMEDDLTTVHHELGHNYYYLAYNKLPILYQSGANDGFHEAIGDAMALSITPAYLKELGLLKTVAADDKGLINVQMKDALEKIAFLPFGLLIDKWRWDVFAGKTKPGDYNKAWWELRRRYQGVAPPVPRTDEDFDPGAKYHVPANVPYTRYFLARLLQFQFHRALCQAAGHQGPLHACSIYGNRDAGTRLWKMLELGASKPWPEALAALTGERQIEATGILEYFAPLRAWLDQQNAGQKCGW
jgi:peptidyl-dipeptidase A